MKKELLQKALNKEQDQQHTIEEMPASAPAPNIRTPDSFIMNPILSIYTAIDDLALEVGDLKKSNNTNEQLLRAILDRDTKMLDLQLQEADEGGVLRRHGIASTTKFVIIDCKQDPGHNVKGYTVKNDGPSILFVGHNVPKSPEVDADVIDIKSMQSRFEKVESGEPIKFTFNRQRIESIHILSDPDSALAPSAFRVWLVW